MSEKKGEKSIVVFGKKRVYDAIKDGRKTPKPRCPRPDLTPKKPRTMLQQEVKENK